MRPLSSILLIAAAATAAAAPRADISITATADSAVVLMGKRATVTYAVDMPAADASRVQLTDLPLLTPGQEFLEWNGVDIVAADSTTVIADGRRRVTYKYTVQPFDPGTLTLPPVKVYMEGASDTARSNVLTLKVLPVEIDSTFTLNPMEPVVSARTKWYDYIPDVGLWILLGIVILALGAGLWLMLRKRREVEEVRRATPKPPYELAMERFDALRGRQLIENGHEKEFYTELVDIVRQYLAGRFGINAMEMTSTQIVKALRSNPETRTTADEMRAVLSMADFVKFAKVRPLPDDNIRAYNRARDFVEQTKPAPEPEAPADGTSAPTASAAPGRPTNNESSTR